jgi:hypothetical protein
VIQRSVVEELAPIQGRMDLIPENAVNSGGVAGEA